MKQKKIAVKALRFTFLTIFSIGTMVGLNSCKDEFTEEDALRLEQENLLAQQAAADAAARQAMADAAANAAAAQATADEIADMRAELAAIGGIIDYTVNVVYGNTASFNSFERTTNDVTGAEVTVTQFGQSTTVAVDASGMANFPDLRIGRMAVNVRLDGFTPVDFLVDISGDSDACDTGLDTGGDYTPGGAISAPETRIAGTLVPIFEIPSDNNSAGVTAGADMGMEKVGMIMGRLTADIDLTNKEVEVVPAGTTVAAAIDANSTVELLQSGMISCLGEVIEASYTAANFVAATDEAGDYTLVVPSFPTGEGLTYSMTFSDFAADQTLYTTAVGGAEDAGAPTYEASTVRVVFSADGDGGEDYSADLRSVDVVVAPVPTGGRGAELDVTVDYTAADAGVLAYFTNITDDEDDNYPAGGDVVSDDEIALVLGGGAVDKLFDASEDGTDVDDNTLTFPFTYTQAPMVMVEGGGGSGAAITATTDGSSVTFTLDDGGSGYTSAPSVAIMHPEEMDYEPGAEIYRAEGQVSNLTSAGTGVIDISLDDNGYGIFTQAPTAALANVGDGTGATIEAVIGDYVNSGTYKQVDKIIVTAPGDNYAGGTSVAISEGIDTRATLTPLILEDIQAPAGLFLGSDAAGTGYSAPIGVDLVPVMRNADDDEFMDASAWEYAPATFTVEMEGTPLNDVFVTEAGLGYTMAPGVTINDTDADGNAVSVNAFTIQEGTAPADYPTALSNYITSVDNAGAASAATIPVFEIELSETGPINTINANPKDRSVTFSSALEFDDIEVTVTQVNGSAPTLAQSTFRAVAELSTDPADIIVGSPYTILPDVADDVENVGLFFQEPFVSSDASGVEYDVDIRFDRLGAVEVDFDDDEIDGETEIPAGDDDDSALEDAAEDDMWMRISIAGATQAIILEIEQTGNEITDLAIVQNGILGSEDALEDLVTAVNAGGIQPLFGAGINGPTGVVIGGTNFTISLHEEQEDAEDNVEALTGPITYNVGANLTADLPADRFQLFTPAASMVSVDVISTTGATEILGLTEVTAEAVGDGEDAVFQDVIADISIGLVEVTAGLGGSGFRNGDEIELTFTAYENDNSVGAPATTVTYVGDGNGNFFTQEVAKRIEDISFANINFGAAGTFDAQGQGFNNPTFVVAAPDIADADAQGFTPVQATADGAADGLSFSGIQFTGAGAYGYQVDGFVFILTPAAADAGNNSAELNPHIFDNVGAGFAIAGGATKPYALADFEPTGADNPANTDYVIADIGTGAANSTLAGGAGYEDGTLPSIVYFDGNDLTPSTSPVSFDDDVDYPNFAGGTSTYFATLPVAGGAVTGVDVDFNSFKIGAGEDEADLSTIGFSISTQLDAVDVANVEVGAVTAITGIEVLLGGGGYTAEPLVIYADATADRAFETVNDYYDVVTTVVDGRVTAVTISGDVTGDDGLELNDELIFAIAPADVDASDDAGSLVPLKPELGVDITTTGTITAIDGFDATMIRSDIDFNQEDLTATLIAYDSDGTVGSGAAIDPIFSNEGTGEIIGFDVTAGGSGYQDWTQVVISLNYGATGASGDGSITAEVAAGGLGFVGAPLIVFEPSAGDLGALGLESFTAGGADKDEILPRLLAAISAGFDVALATGVVENGAVTGVNFEGEVLGLPLGNGSGYTEAPAVVHIFNFRDIAEFAWAAAGNDSDDFEGFTTATAEAVVEDGVVTGVVVTDRGNGYPFAPAIGIQGEGSGATAVASIDATGKVTGVEVTEGGTGYIQPNFPAAPRAGDLDEEVTTINVLGGTTKVMDVHYGTGDDGARAAAGVE